MTAARRAGAVAVVLAVAVLVAVLLFGGGSGYRVQLRLENASQLVKGNNVQVAGTRIGTVKEIGLSDDGLALITLEIDGDHSPLRQGTRAVVRQASLSGVANRYVDLQQGPMTAKEIESGSVLPAETTEAAVDLDQLFAVFDPRTRRAARAVIRGFADMTQDRNQEANEAIKYLNPVLTASSRLFAELNRNDRLLERFVVESSQLVTDVDAEREDLAGIVSNFGTVSTALASQDAALADAIQRLPGFLRKSNSTFVNLRATLDDLDPLVDAARPVVDDLRPLMADLRPFARAARPTLRDLSRTIRRRGARNDLVELLRAQPRLARAAVERVQAHGELRDSAFSALAASLKGSTPPLAFLRPYAPELTGWFDDFSTSGAYDANGSFSRAGLVLSAFTFSPILGTLLPVPPALRDEVLAAGAKLGRNDRCPGSNERTLDGSNPYKPSPEFNCDETIQPVGP